MKIPKKIKIIGKTYTVKIVNEVDKDDSWGRMCFSTSEILIKKSTDYQTQCETLFHEIMHIFFEHAGLEHNENKIDLFGKLLYQIIPQIEE